MNILITLLFFLSLPVSGQQAGTGEQVECDSASIASSATRFYDWYLKELTRPKENWTNKKLEIDTEAYIKALKNLEILSDAFFELEEKRFANCIDAAESITYERILECGCSVGSMVNECKFFDGFHWIATHEIYDGVTVSSIACEGTIAVCDLQFYYETPAERGFDEFFTSRIKLSKYGADWLIDKIEPERKRRK